MEKREIQEVMKKTWDFEQKSLKNLDFKSIFKF